MDDGWHFSIVTAERALPLIEQPVLKKLRDEQRWGTTAPPVRGEISGAVLWVTTSPEGPPLFVQIVLGPDNFYENTSSATPA